MSADKHLTDIFKGMTVDPKSLVSEGWFDQGSANAHYGLPKKKNLWLRRMNPKETCCHTVWLFVMMQFDDQHKIISISTEVHQVFNDGSYENLGLPFFPHDYEEAKVIINTVCVHSKTKKSAPTVEPIIMQDFIDIIEAGLSSAKLKKVLKKYSLRESLGMALLDTSREFVDDDKRIEMQADFSSRIRNVFLKSLTDKDVLINGITSKSTRNAVHKKLGPPTSSAEEGWWDRFDNEQYCLHFQYGKNKKIRQISIMSASAAP